MSLACQPCPSSCRRSCPIEHCKHGDVTVVRRKVRRAAKERFKVTVTVTRAATVVGMSNRVTFPERQPCLGLPCRCPLKPAPIPRFFSCSVRSLSSGRTMVDHTTLPLQADNNRSVFLEHAWNIGRAYRNQALELISICRLLSQIAPPKLAREDAEMRR